MPYMTTAEVETRIEILSLLFPTLCQRLALPNTTHEGRASHALRIRTGPRVTRPGVYLIGGVHAREWGSPDILIFFAEALLGAYQNNSSVVLLGKTFTVAQIKSILENVELVVFPVVNPDGRTYSQTTDIWWRKNRGPTPTAGVLGIDINRNYDFLWNFTVQFAPGLLPASTNPIYETYHGTAAWSEPETKNIKYLVDLHPTIRHFVDVHSYSQLILYPWGDDAAQTTDTAQHFQNAAFDGTRGITADTAYREFMEPVDLTRYQAVSLRLNQALQQVRGKTYIQGPGATTLYIVSGASKDYMYARHLADPPKLKIDSYLFEWGTQFQPPYAEMDNIIKDVSAALIELCLVAQQIPLLQRSPDPLDFAKVRTGTSKARSVTVRNIGVGAAELFNIQVTGAGFSTSASALGPIAEGALVQVPVAYAPTIVGAQQGRLTFQFRQPGSTLSDVAHVRLQGVGCTVKEGACTAPVFEPSNWLSCLILWIISLPVIMLLILFSWIPAVRCQLKQLLFRLSHCSTGNSDPCREI